MRIVRWENKFGIERGWIFKSYFDLVNRRYWWSAGGPWFQECWSEDLTKVKRVFACLRPKIEPFIEQRLS